MKVCEACIAHGYTERVYQGNRVKVLCPVCLGVGSLSLGYESHAKWNRMRQQAIERGEREGWLEEVWAGEPGNARKVLAPMRQDAKRRTA